MSAIQKFQGAKRKCIKVNAMSFAIMVRNMIDGVYTCQDLADITGLHLTTVYQYTRELHNAGAAYITHFEPDARGRHNVKVFKMGIGTDAKRPRMTQVERQARYRAKIAAQQFAMVTAGKGEYIARSNGRKLFQELAT